MRGPTGAQDDTKDAFQHWDACALASDGRPQDADSRSILIYEREHGADSDAAASDRRVRGFPPDWVAVVEEGSDEAEEEQDEVGGEQEEARRRLKTMLRERPKWTS